MFRTIVALALLTAFGGAAGAQTATPQPAPRLKELVTVSAEVVRIGDLVENAGPVADIPIFRAPDPGHTGSVPLARIAEALRPYNMTGVDAGGLSSVVVARTSRAIGRDEIVSRIARAFAGQFGFGDAEGLSVILDRDVRGLHVEASVTGDLAVARMTFDRRNGRFDVALDLPGSAAARRLPLRFTGTVTETVEVATLAHDLRPGETVKQSDIVMDRRPKAEARGDVIDAAQAIGLAARRPLRGGQVLRPADLAKPQLVQRNEAVTIVYEVPGIMLTVRGKAQEGGAVGDVVNVLNIQTNRTIQATVAGPGRVVIASIAPRFAAAVIPSPNGSAQQRTP